MMNDLKPLKVVKEQEKRKKVKIKQGVHPSGFPWSLSEKMFEKVEGQQGLGKRLWVEKSGRNHDNLSPIIFWWNPCLFSSPLNIAAYFEFI